MEEESIFMQRCLDLASFCAGSVAPNPMVGAILVFEGKILGEGYHAEFGGAHAEVNCLQNVKEEDQSKVADSILYVNLEPCSHIGKTPPCSDLILDRGIGKVRIGCLDPNPMVNGQGLKRLMEAGVDVQVGMLERECTWVNRRFFTFYKEKRPFIILKWAQSKDGFIGRVGSARIKISNPVSDRLVHQWRGEEMGIMVGSQTVLADNPQLTTRLSGNKNPVRIVLDRELMLDRSWKIFNEESDTIIFNLKTSSRDGNIHWIKLDQNEATLPQILAQLYRLNILSVLVEGGGILLQHFIDSGFWDEARVIRSDILLNQGIPAPVLKGASFRGTLQLDRDQIDFYQNIIC